MKRSGALSGELSNKYSSIYTINKGKIKIYIDLNHGISVCKLLAAIKCGRLRELIEKKQKYNQSIEFYRNDNIMMNIGQENIFKIIKLQNRIEKIWRENNIENAGELLRFLKETKET